MTKLQALAASAVLFSIATGPARAADPIPDIDVKLGKKPGGANAQTSGGNSPASAQTEETVSIAVQGESTEQLGNLSLSGGGVGVLSNTVLSGQITGNWTGDDSMDFEAAQKPRDVRIETGEASVNVSAPGVSSVLQNTGLLTLQQGVVSMPVSASVAD